MIVLGLLAVGFLATLVFALATGRVDWRQQGCCAVSDPDADARMREVPAGSPSTVTESRTAP